MRVMTLGALLVLAVLPAFGQESESPECQGEPLPVPMAEHHTGPMKFLRIDPDGTIQTTNWAGWLVTGAAFTFAKGSWTVPSVDCSQTPYSHAAFWVGFDGHTNGTVEQTGIEAFCYNTDAPMYFAWYEFYPGDPYERVISNFPVAAHDVISATVQYTGDDSFTLTITDKTTGTSCHKTQTVRGIERDTAEWIAEAPKRRDGLCMWALSDFGTADFGKHYTGVSGTNDATDNVHSGPIVNFGPDAHMVIMKNKNDGHDLAVPSALLSDGGSFYVTWEAEQETILP